MNERMNADENTRRVTANLPVALLREAQEASGRGITDTLRLGLELVRRQQAAARLLKLRGKVHLSIDVRASRERARR